MRVCLALTVILLAGCSSNSQRSERASSAVADAVVAPAERKHVPIAEREDGAEDTGEVKLPPAKKVVLVDLLVVTPKPGTAVKVDGYAVGKTKAGSDGRGELVVRVTPGEHVISYPGMEQTVYTGSK